MTGWQKFEILCDMLGSSDILDHLARALSDDELGENMDYIARTLDIDLEEEEEED